MVAVPVSAGVWVGVPARSSVSVPSSDLPGPSPSQPWVLSCEQGWRWCQGTWLGSIACLPACEYWQASREVFLLWPMPFNLSSSLMGIPSRFLAAGETPPPQAAEVSPQPGWRALIPTAEGPFP